jgi:hypothetical protein
MGYFSNGTEGAGYEETYCQRCIHFKPDDLCPVWAAHLDHSYTECNNPNTILNYLIPRKGVENLRCTMFIEQSASGDLFEVANV